MTGILLNTNGGFRMSYPRVVAIVILLLIASTVPSVLAALEESPDETPRASIAHKVLLEYNREEIYADQIIVDFTKDLDFSSIQDFAARHELSILRLYPKLGEAVLRISGSNLEEAMFRVAEDPLVRYVSPNGFYTTSYVPNDTNWGNQWGPKKIQAPDAWNLTTGNSSVIVAILDTGVDYLHEDLSGNMWKNPSEDGGVVGVDDDGNGYIDDLYGWNFVNDTEYVMDNNDRDINDNPSPIYRRSCD
jgi:subtilisin family serine protease